MTRQEPRREFHLDTAETEPHFNYVPKKARDKRWAAIFEGRPQGSVIAIEQKIGSEAVLSTIDIIHNEGEDYELRQLCDAISLVLIGTAYHTLGTPRKEDLMYRKIELPVQLDPVTEQRTTKDMFIKQTKSGLAVVSQLATNIEKLVRQGDDAYEENEKIGRVMAHTGFLAAAVGNQIHRVQGNEVELQDASWKTSRRAAVRTLEMTGVIGARPTMAQVANPNAPYRRYLHDTPEVLSSDVLSVLVEEVGRITREERDRQEAFREDRLF